MDLKVVIAGGGTGGHLFPGIAVAQEFQSSLAAAVTFLTSPKPVTGKILERYGFPWEAIASRAARSSSHTRRASAVAGTVTLCAVGDGRG